MQIYLARNNQQAGPYTLEQLNAMLASNEVLLTDLMWHDGMDKWQSVGQMTGNQLSYRTNIKSVMQPMTTPVNPTNQTNPNANPNNDNHPTRVTVEQLYGRKPIDTKQPTGDTSIKEYLTEQKQQTNHHNKTTPTNQLASVSKRILAVLIDQLIMIAAIFPLLMHTGMDVLSKPMTSAHVQSIVESVPNHIMTISALMILAVFVVQTLMLIKKGQTLGKMAVGLRILDKNSLSLPSVTNILLIRTVLTNIAYSVPIIGMLLLVADFIIMIIDKQKQSLHDKLAKTVVMIADDAQLNNKA
ncbi:RDD family protein [Moraxella lincolnii]|uniref:RDD family protein n=1 Tax=Lwoffella lincolnii TaxID=90241 RepID=A0A1T0CGT2_9GAMM|nr:RDD family protein [Moraxella lincolnii]OOS21562.1 hypothetical protein B0682_02435 [Moraxella lincolnii]